MKRSLTVLAVLAMVAAFGIVPAAAAPGPSVALDAGGTVTVIGTAGDDLVEVTIASSAVTVEVGTLIASFPADEVVAFSMSTGAGDDRVIMQSWMPAWSFHEADFDLGTGALDGVTISVLSYSAPNTLSVTGDIRSRGGSFGLRAGTETVASTFRVLGDVTAIGSPTDDNFGLETEMPTGTIIVEGDVRFQGGPGDDYAELLINGHVTVAGDFTVLGQAGDDWVFLDGNPGGSGTVGGFTRLLGGPGEDWLDLGDGFHPARTMIKQFEVCTGCS